LDDLRKQNGISASTNVNDTFSGVGALSDDLYDIGSKDDCSFNISKGDIIKEIYENNLNADSPRFIFPSKVSMQKTHDIRPSSTLLPKLDLGRVLSKTPNHKAKKPAETLPNNGFLKNYNTTVYKKATSGVGQEKELQIKIEQLTKELIASNHRIEELKNKLEKYKRNYKEMKSKTNKLKENLKLANNKIEILKMQIRKFEKNKPIKQDLVDDSDELNESSVDISITELDTNKYSEQVTSSNK
jgi:hypothetical protein